MADRAELEGFNEIRYASSGYTLDSTAEKERIAKCVSLLKASKPSKILDVGCSDGIISEVLKRETGAYLIGMDASATALKKARLVCDEVQQAEFGTQPIPLPDACVDGIFAGEVIEHVFYTEAFLEELLRVAKPGCRMAISTPNLASWYNRIFVLLGLQPLFTETGVRISSSGNRFTKPNLPAGHIRNFTLSSLKHLLKTCGWEVEETHGIALLGNKWRPLDRFFSALSPAIAADLILLCRRP
jgi:2-polyprenyl-3-methyl-5-hydroxy-6-metoxy-1,4-benzoquinol methylase